MTKNRSELLQEDRWNVEALYPNLDIWQKAYDSLSHEGQRPRWPELTAFRDKFHEGPQILKSALELAFSLDRELSKIYTYAHLRHDEELTNDQAKIAFNRALGILHDFHQETSWIDPEILALPDATIQTYLSSPILADYRFHLEKIVRIKAHTLSPEKEELLAIAGKALQTGYKAFSAISDADFKFGTVLDNQENEHELTHGTYGIYSRSQDRVLRKNAFKKMHGKYAKYENTLAELLNGQVQNHIFNARARHYSSSLEAALFPKNIDVDVYHSLIQAVHENIDALHKYVQLRKQILGLDPLHIYDLNVPLTPNLDIKMSYSKAAEAVIDSVAPLGAEYQNLLRQGLKSERWVDRYENKNKRSGAYSSGCYDSMPYILMNYKDLLRDVFTLAHEAGHSMHSLLSHKNQPYHYGDYPIFLAEVASTFNEELLMKLLLERATNKQEKIFLINQKIEDIRATFFRQVMFAEFELSIHEKAENNIPLTPALLKDIYRNLNTRYFGDALFLDPESDIEWARIPHFYYNFYVFQYATGISAALTLTEKVIKGGKAEREAYLSFLKGGSSRYPIEMLQTAGVDMRSSQPVKATITKFSELVEELRLLLLPNTKRVEENVGEKTNA